MDNDAPKNKGGRPRTFRNKIVGVRMTAEEQAFCASMDPKGEAASYLRVLMEQHRQYLAKLPVSNHSST